MELTCHNQLPQEPEGSKDTGSTPVCSTGVGLFVKILGSSGTRSELICLFMYVPLFLLLHCQSSIKAGLLNISYKYSREMAESSLARSTPRTKTCPVLMFEDDPRSYSRA